MKKFKINANFLALLVIISLFAGWEYMIVVTAFIWCFCESSQNLKNLTISAIAIFAGCYVFMWLWDVIESIYSIGIDSLTGLITILGNYGVDVLELSIKLDKYLVGTLDVVMDLASSVVYLLVLLTKFKFIVSIISNKPMTGAFSKIQEYINYFINFANSNLYEEQQYPQQPVQQPVQQPEQQYPQQAQ